MTAKKLNFDKLTSNEDIALAIDMVALESDTLQLRIHQIIVAMACKWAVDGDVRDPVKHMNLLVEKLGKGVRKNALIEFATSDKLFGFLVHEQTKVLVAGKMTGAKLNIKLIIDTKWYDFKEPPLVKDWNLVDGLKKVVATANTKAAKGRVGDVIDPKLLSELVAILDAIDKADKLLLDDSTKHGSANEPTEPQADPLENVA